MKKSILMTMSLIMLLSLWGCSGKYINELSDGSIKDLPLMSSYENGSYIALGKYFDNEDKFPYIKIKVENNIITYVEFDYIFSNGNSLSAQTGDETTELKSQIKSLNSLVIQEQKSIKTASSVQEQLADNYKALLSQVLENAKEGNEEISVVDLKLTYSQATEVLDPEGYESLLKATFKDGVISEIEFSQINPVTHVSKNNDSEFTDSFQDKYDISYNKFISAMEEDSVGEDKIKEASYTNETSLIFNQLSLIINQRRREVDSGSYFSLISSTP